MDLQLNNRLALVSGSTAGIGYSIAEALLREGARVIVNGRSQASVDASMCYRSLVLLPNKLRYDDFGERIEVMH